MNPLKTICRSIPLLRYLRNAQWVCAQPSYYPELPRKSWSRRFWEVLLWDVKERNTDSFYNIYGLDVTGMNRAMRDFMPYFGYLTVMRDEANGLGSPGAEIAVLRDKFLFSRFMEQVGIPTPPVFALLVDGTLYDASINPCTHDIVAGKTGFFVKDINGECASYVKRMADAAEFQRELPNLAHGAYILQEAVSQHPQVAEVYAGSINTVRLVTVRVRGSIEVFGAVMRFGNSMTGCVDNSAAGGTCIGVDCDAGRLMKYGFYKPGIGTKTEEHPDTHVIFEGFQIPCFDEAMRLAKIAHRSLPRVHSIGWDIAISPSGPVFIEGNDNWEIKSLQAAYGGLKERWYDCFPDSVTLPKRLRRRKDGSLP